MYLAWDKMRTSIKTLLSQHTQHAHNDLLGLFLYRERSDKSSDFFGSLRLRKLVQMFLPSPNTCVDDLQEELARTRIKYEDGTVYRRKVSISRLILVERLTDRLHCRVSLESLVSERKFEFRWLLGS
jgi:hypothetical protein